VTSGRKNVVVSLEIRFLAPPCFSYEFERKGFAEKEFVSVGKQRRELAGFLLACAEGALPLGWIGDSRLRIARDRYNIK